MDDEYLEGREFYINGVYDKALQKFEEAVHKDSDNIQYLFALGKTRRYLGENELSINNFDQILSKEPLHIKSKMEKIIALSNLERYSEAIELVDSAINVHRNGIFLARKAVILQSMHKSKSQVNGCISDALKLNKEEPYNWYLSGAAHFYYQNWDQALNSYNKALKFSNELCNLDEGVFISTSDLLLCKLELYYAIHELEKGLECTKEYLKLYPKNLDALYYRSEFYFLLGEFDNSLIVLKRALNINPNNIDLLNLKAIIYDMDGAPNTALSIYNRILEIDPEYEPAICNISILYFFKKEYQKALEFAEKVLKLNPKNGYALYWGSRAARKLNNLRLARKWEQELNDPEIDKIFLEKNLQEKIVNDDWRLGNCGYNLKLKKKEFKLKDRPGRIDLLYEDKNGNFVVVELKVQIASEAVYNQIMNYVDSIKNTLGRNKKVTGLVIGLGQDDNFKNLVKNNRDISYLDLYKLGLG